MHVSEWQHEAYRCDIRSRHGSPNSTFLGGTLQNGGDMNGEMEEMSEIL